MAKKHDALASPSPPPATSLNDKEDDIVELSGPPEPTGDQAIWNDAEIKELLEQLVEHKSSAGQGGNFTKDTFNTIARQVDKHRTAGAQKTGAMCTTKYCTLPDTHKTINRIRKWSSGMHFDNMKGANIDATTKPVWDTLEKKYPAVGPFRNAGWAWLSWMDQLNTKATSGSHVRYQGTSKFAAGVNKKPEVEQKTATKIKKKTVMKTERLGSPAWIIENRGSLPEDDTVVTAPASREASPAPTQSSALSAAVAAVTATPVATQHKRASSGLTPSTEPLKCSRGSEGSRALAALAETSHKFVDIFGDVRDVLAAPQGSSVQLSPQRRMNAMERTQKLETHLSNNDLAILIDILGEANKADTYNMLQNNGLCISWVNKQLREHSAKHASGNVDLFSGHLFNGNTRTFGGNNSFGCGFNRQNMGL
ncbi:unnamed protein product [Mycena citricolor]|uniref:Myb/SANT-like domain-containing protein n=1 Tax=Mycena citricolor TaxID=2018698 RepID=A0AAD2GRQ4_9AGAR|nr:unnamed protein product [Mycena citricolor]